MIQRVILHHFRGFAHFELSLGQTNVLIGPNNAGKSTLIAALRAVDLMLRHAHAKNPTQQYVDRDVRVLGYPVSPRHFAVEEESLRFNSRKEETRLDLRLRSGAAIHVVWPADELGGFFYLMRSDDVRPRNTSEVRETFPLLGVVPPLSQLEQREPLLEPNTVRDGAHTRRASRHFRNQLYLLADANSSTTLPGGLGEYLEYVREWLQGSALDAPQLRYDEGGAYLELPYWEGLNWRELSWSGDGVQVFLQLLFHCYRLRDHPTIIIDEPDIYLHADLQSRLWQLLDERPGQLILATHSTEIAGSVPPKATIWIDRERTHALRLKTDAEADHLIRVLGAHFNTRAARALRARLVLFVEGHDAKLLGPLAKLVGADRIAREMGVAIVPVHGSENWRLLAGFAWLRNELLRNAASAVLLLDRDYKSPAYIAKIEGELREAGVDVRVWRRHEIENYCLESAAIARCSGAPVDWVVTNLGVVTEAMKEEIGSSMMSARLQEPVDHGKDAAKLLRACQKERDTWWSDPIARLHLCPGKETISRLNDRLQAAGYEAVSPRRVVRSLRTAEIDHEVRELLRELDAVASR